MWQLTHKKAYQVTFACLEEAAKAEDKAKTPGTVTLTYREKLSNSLGVWHGRAIDEVAYDFWRKSISGDHKKLSAGFYSTGLGKKADPHGKKIDGGIAQPFECTN